MDDYVHHVSGFFVHRNEADEAYRELVARGLPRERLQLLAAESLEATKPEEAESRSVLKDMLVDGAIGTVVGTGLGAVGQVALVAANVSLFVASPLLAPLAMLGWGAALGGIVGAAAGAEKVDGKLSDLVRDAVASGQSVLVAETRSEQETNIAREVIQAAVGEYKDSAAS
ncbi:MAG TPA: hypothetical protein VJ673_10340 [Aromatoleum sp.]|uniref:hypothetical protein n=1 Tax=Aromatoleum sp. TaxID=2307007 RepID=UPI002B4A6CBD|nr:hypothetical protein [Aromatoleum sp.]HJV26081.1 hypothetical protein [Aromatoleum sp.]